MGPCASSVWAMQLPIELYGTAVSIEGAKAKCMRISWRSFASRGTAEINLLRIAAIGAT